MEKKRMALINLVFLIQILFTQVKAYNYSFINLPEDHLSTYFSNNPDLSRQCENDKDCPFKEYLNKKSCWGYEYNCDENKRLGRTHCPGDHKGWVQSKASQESTFFAQADFGYVKQQMREMKIMCEPLFPDDSSLECSENLRFCRGRNLMVNFTSLMGREDPIRYKMDVLGEGDIGGFCEFNKARLMKETEHLSPLQSWAPEMRYFTQLYEKPIAAGKCDVIIEKPTYIMKIDATVNMYHHFCDFINLYASQHLNIFSPNAFSTDVHILIWESYTYHSAFEATFQAFTQHPIWDLKTFRGETVCFKNAIFPLLPRMIFGLYYNTPIIYGCENSTLFHAFSKHVLHRLGVKEFKREDDSIRITLLSRETKFRRIINEDELIDSLKSDSTYNVQRVVFNRDVSFKKQLEIMRNTDVLIGIHGAGLTHSLFMPDWAAVFELYNCDDANCYKDLTRLRGLKYVTWEDERKITEREYEAHREGTKHAKFANYAFDVDEFLRLVKKATNHVKEHPVFQQKIKKFVDKEVEIEYRLDNGNYKISGKLEDGWEDVDNFKFEEGQCPNLGSAEPLDYDTSLDEEMFTDLPHDEL